jgi:carboxypeptidase Taq
MKQHLKVYLETRKRLKAYSYLMWLMSWDAETEAPKGSIEYRAKQTEVMSNEIYAIEADPKYMEAIEYLYAHLNELDQDLATEMKHQKKSLRWIQKVPKEDYIQYQVLMSKSSHIWAEARANNDFKAFAPTLKEIVAYNRKFIQYLEDDALKGYDVLLDMYEEGFTQKEYDHFFNTLKTHLVDFVKEVTKQPKPVHEALAKGPFDKEKQKAFSEYLLDVFGYSRQKGLLKTSTHPFTSGVASVDTRITTRYLEDQLSSSIFSTIHEMGHGLYEMQVDQKYDETYLNGGTSLGIHESQSRMYENMIGRSKAFWSTHLDKLKAIFAPQLDEVSLEDFLLYVNRAERTLIRVEADELTYALHVMLRYDIEKDLMSGKLAVDDLPQVWNDKIEAYLGIRPKNDQEGVLQDIHWSGGSFGYFPTYALGSAYAAQIYDQMSKEIDIEGLIRANNIKAINEWTQQHIHQYGASKTPKEIMMIATKQPFDPMYYVNYLKSKYQ